VVPRGLADHPGIEDVVVHGRGGAIGITGGEPIVDGEVPGVRSLQIDGFRARAFPDPRMITSWNGGATIPASAGGVWRLST
jgi:hypothetical protein